MQLINTEFRHALPLGARSPRVAGTGLRLKPHWALLAAIAVMNLAPAIAVGQDDKAAATPTASQAPTTAPDFLGKLELSAKQQDQIKEIVREYDVSIGKVWKHFGDRYMQTISTESSLLAAIEDNLTEAQRERIREHRRKTAKHEKQAAASTEKPNPPKEGADEVVAQEIDSVGVVLTPEQEEMADKIQDNYRAHLRSLNRDIQSLHARLLSLEAERLVAIEKVLTKEQLSQLRTHRKHAPGGPKANHTKIEVK